MLREITDKTAWEERLQGLATPPFVQSWDWGEFQRAIGERVLRLADGEAFGQVVERRLPGGFKLWQIPRGPWNFAANQYDNLLSEARRSGAIMVRLEPNVRPPIGYRVEAQQPPVTLHLDLQRPEAAIMNAMHPKTRYNIRLAIKKGVAVDESDLVGDWLGLIRETATRDGFRAHPEHHYRHILTVPFAKLFVARFGERSLAAVITTFYGGAATYLHGASSNDHRELMAPYALHWQIIQRAKALGYRHYDWWGVNPSDPQHWAYKPSWDGLSIFKRRFGGREVVYPGTFEVPVRPLWYKLYELRRKLLRG